MDNFDPDTIFKDKESSLVAPSAEEVRIQRLQARANQGKDVPEKYRSLITMPPKADNKSTGQNKKKVRKKSTESVIEPPVSRIKVIFELSGGLYTVPAIEVKECKYGVMVLLPNGMDDTTFTPLPGTELILHWDDKQLKCFSPGITFDFIDYKFTSIVLIKG